ncbi:MAG: hypothetical protein IJC88_06405 [Oscillospiraceae bacterium]|nr:hypothetical protein [Oscillospiraceae bacterium]
MAMDAILQITEAETAAEAKKKQAAADAKAKVNEARRDGQAEIEAANRSAEGTVKELLVQAEQAASVSQMKIMAQAESDCEKLRILARGRMQRAAELIVERVEGESCQS